MILVFSGKLGVGKNHISETYFIPLILRKLKELFPHKIWVPYFYNMGSFLKSQLYAENKFNFKDLFIDKHHHVRNELQSFGSYCRDKYNKDYWIHHVDMWIQLTQHELTMINKGLDNEYEPLFIIQDLRYKNELEYFKKQKDCHIIRIIASDRNHIKAEYEKADIHHTSETDLDDVHFDHILYNDITNHHLLSDIHNMIDSIINHD